VALVPDDYPSETSWALTFNDAVVEEGRWCGAAVSVCDPGAYQFTIFDTAGTGICCENGEGHYTVAVDGVQVASGGDFTYEETTDLFQCAPIGAPADLAEGCAVIEVALVPDDYPEETSWALTFNFPASTSWALTFNDAVVEEGRWCGAAVSVCDPGTYQFTIFDTAGDGICCAYGEGNYTVAVDGVQVASGGDFTYEETTEFEV
jgi:hypothetical protein